PSAQADVVQHRNTGLVGETHMLELQRQRGVTVGRSLRVNRIWRLELEQSKNSFSTSKRALQQCVTLSKRTERFEKLTKVGGESNDSTKSGIVIPQRNDD